MTNPRTYQETPPESPLDGRLLEGDPAIGCKVCTALAVQRREARARNDWAAACAAAREIRNHGRGHGEAG
ncbi:hypothetical protein EST92_07725 [Streptomyces sp. TM32]|nr:hypothetical protein EST92_07725 [Streptomyces sp. TM32]